MSTRRDPTATIALLIVAALVAGGALFFVFGATPPPDAGAGVGRPAPSASASPTPRPRPPEVAITHDANKEQAARFLRAAWTSSEAVSTASVTLAPDPGFECSATVGEGGRKGTFGCAGLLRGATSYTATLTLRTPAGSFPFAQAFTTLGDRLVGVKWFTEFEDPRAEPLACAAASVRIVHVYTTGQDPLTAEQILRQGQTLNRSRDPGIDPVAIAALQKRLDARNNYHYYRFDTREDATAAAVYWLMRSGKPVHTITLAGQHDPVLIGFRGTYGAWYGDPSNSITGVVVQDPQRGDMRLETASRRPDKYRTPEFQTGRLLELSEWYRDEWWLAFSYASVVDGVNIDRNDGAYPLPHWAGKFVIILDDADAEWPSDREGRVVFR